MIYHLLQVFNSLIFVAKSKMQPRKCLVLYCLVRKDNSRLLENLQGFLRLSHRFVDARLKQSKLRSIVLLELLLGLVFLDSFLKGVKHLQCAGVVFALWTRGLSYE